VKSATILVVDDEPQIRRVLRTTLSAQGYVIVEARDGEEALVRLRSERPDLVLLDMNMPVMEGLETCRQMRSDSNIPIIMLTVRNAEIDKVRALDAGADDYVVKPFGIQELLARVRAALRRLPSDESNLVVTSKELAFDFEKRLIEVHLTPKEFELLRQLAASQGRPISHRRLLQAVWGPDYGDETESLRVVINQLRKKIESDPAKPKYIRTEPWVGYRFVVDEEAAKKTGDALEDGRGDGPRPARSGKTIKLRDKR
jgi:two-component system KDP operon response regulator KdpE